MTVPWTSIADEYRDYQDFEMTEFELASLQEIACFRSTLHGPAAAIEAPVKCGAGAAVRTKLGLFCRPDIAWV